MYNKLRKLNYKKKTQLHYAAKKNLREKFELLLSKGANINEEDKNYQYILLQFISL